MADANDRRKGFMLAIGFLLTHVKDAGVHQHIIDTLKNNEPLSVHIANDEYAVVANNNGINPCPRGMVWDPATGMCV